MEIDEYYGASFYNKYDMNGNRIVTSKTSNKLFRILYEIMLIFLPQGYPHSVSKDYMQYQLWDSLQAYCSTISGSLAMQAVLQGSGVGNENASVIAATITWILKDGTGMVGRIWFAWWKSVSLDANCKRWRLFADILNDISIYIDIFAAMWLAQFRMLSCVASFLRALVGVAGGATRSSITQHQALRHNTADVSAKDSSQETLVNLLGLISSIIILPYFTNIVHVLVLLTFLTVVHLFANYKAVGSLQFDTLNRDRFHTAAMQYFSKNEVASIESANRNEMLILARSWKLKVNLGCSFSQFIAGIAGNNYDKSVGDLLNYFAETKYMLNINSKNNSVDVIFKSDATSLDYIMANYHFEYLNYIFKLSDEVGSSEILSNSLKHVKERFENFVNLLRKEGWRLDVVWLSQNEWTFQTHSKNN